MWFSFWDAMVALLNFGTFTTYSSLSSISLWIFAPPSLFSAVPFEQLSQMVMGSSPPPFRFSGSGTNEQGNGRKHFIGPKESSRMRTMSASENSCLVLSARPEGLLAGGVYAKIWFFFVYGID